MAKAVEKLSPARKSWPLLPGLELANRGKVRDTYKLSNGLLLVVCTDAISVIDFVLDALVPMKGIILNTMTHFWVKHLEAYGIKTHFVATGKAIDEYLPEALRNDSDLQARSMVVRSLEMVSVEFVIRAELTGSGLKSYKENRTICGIKLPEGLQDGDTLPWPLDTPTTKAEVGHDEPLDAEEIRFKYSEETFLALQVFQIARSFARSRGIVLVDSKLELGRDENDNLVIGDELFTPDSSRFWSYQEWVESRKSATRKAPGSFDKEPGRAWGKTFGLDDKTKFNPEKPEDVARVHGIEVPQDLITQLTERYRYIFFILTGMTIEAYLKQLGVDLPRPKKRLTVILGSKNDLPGIRGDLQIAFTKFAGDLDGPPRVHAVSCHRNPDKLEMMVQVPRELGINPFEPGRDVIIAAGGKALALPGVLDALLHKHKLNIPVIGVALGTSGSPAFEAAVLSIAELPGSPVVMDEKTGVYKGSDGLHQAIERVALGELPPLPVRVKKEAEFNVDISKV